MVFWVFNGDMVGKRTNEPCNGVDEVVNHFWVLTVTILGTNIDLFSFCILFHVSYQTL